MGPVGCMLFQHAIHWPSLLSEGRIFGQIAQNRLQKYFLAGKNGGRKTSDFFSKSCRKQAGKYFRQIYEVNLYFIEFLQLLRVSNAINK
jgi:hypothetical protein